MMHWTDKFPELVTFLAEEVKSKLDPYGMTYYSNIDRSFDLYGYVGLSMQLLYVSSNLQKGNKKVEKELERWSKVIDEETVDA